jgi:hypothetical protein
MTKNEKLMNRESLNAYKNHDRDYAPLVAGISSTKKFLNARITPKANEVYQSSQSQHGSVIK